MSRSQPNHYISLHIVHYVTHSSNKKAKEINKKNEQKGKEKKDLHGTLCFDRLDATPFLNS